MPDYFFFFYRVSQYSFTNQVEWKNMSAPSPCLCIAMRGWVCNEELWRIYSHLKHLFWQSAKVLLKFFKRTFRILAVPLLPIQIPERRQENSFNFFCGILSSYSLHKSVAVTLQSFGSSHSCQGGWGIGGAGHWHIRWGCIVHSHQFLNWVFVTYIVDDVNKISMV